MPHILRRPATLALLAGLWLAIPAQSNCAAPLPPVVHGRVVLDTNGNGSADAGERGLAGVSVSDGYTVVKTASDGAYCLALSRFAMFVHVVRPAGHDVAGPWYKPPTARVDFCLKPTARSEQQYAFVHVTDSHVTTDPRSLAGLARFVAEVNAMDPRPRFVVNTGNVVFLDMRLATPESKARQFFDGYTRVIHKLQVPHYAVMGNHDNSGYRLADFPAHDPRRAKHLFGEYLGPNFFAFEYGRLHFACVDVFQYPQKKLAYTLAALHVAWLDQDVAHRTPGTAVVTASHKTLDSAMPGLADLAREHSIRLQLVGDDHIVSCARDPIPTRIGGALCGSWWSGPCRDLSPQGYMVYHVDGTALDAFYKGLGERVAVLSPSYGSAVQGQVTVRAHVAQSGPGDALSYAVAPDAWRPMREVARPPCRAVYEAAWDSTGTADGLVTLSVKNARDGETRSCKLVVHNGAALAKFAADATLSFDFGRIVPAPKPPRGAVDVLVNGASIGRLAPGRKKPCVFTVPAALLSTVTRLTFRFAQPGDGMTITYPLLTASGQTCEDPRGAALRAVRRASLPDKSFACIVGDGIEEGAFALKQDAFHFVLTAPPIVP